MYCGAALAQAESLLSGILFSLTAHRCPPFTWSGKWGMVYYRIGREASVQRMVI